MPTTEAAFAVTDPRAAALVVDPAARRYLHPFLGRERTVAQVARELREDPNGVLYRVRRLVGAGLLRVVRSEPRRGRPVKVYTAVADRLFVPYALAPDPDLRAALRRERAALEERLLAGVAHAMGEVGGGAGWGLLTYREGDTLYTYDARPGEAPWEARGADDPALLDYSFEVDGLSHERAKALQRDLRAVLARYFTGEPPGGGGRYAVRVALAPLPPDVEP